jgi:hypothetical protein
MARNCQPAAAADSSIVAHGGDMVVQQLSLHWHYTEHGPQTAAVCMLWAASSRQENTLRNIESNFILLWNPGISYFSTFS